MFYSSLMNLMTVISFFNWLQDIIQSAVKKSSHLDLQGFKAIYCGRRVQKHYISY